MHTKAIGWIVGLLFVFTDALAQEERVTVLDGPGWAGSIGPYEDSLLLVVGSTHRGRFPDGSGIHCIVDKNLKLIERVEDGMAYHTSFQSYVITGDTIVFFGSAYNTFVGMKFQGLIYKFHDYAPVGFYRFGGPKWEMFLRGALVDERFYGIGMTTTSEDQEPDTSPLDFYVCKVGRTGEPVWSLSYGTPLQDNLAEVVWSLDSTTMLLAGSAETDFPYTSFGNLVLIDTAGQILWQKEFRLADNSDFTFITAACRAPDDGYYIALRGDHSSWAFYPSIGKVDGNGDTVFIKRFHNAALHDTAQANRQWRYARFHSIQTLRNGDLLVTGYWNTSATVEALDALVVRCTPEGKTIWRYEYDSLDNDRFTNAYEDEDGYIYACGYTSQIGEPGNMLLAKFDPYGCVLETCVIPTPRPAEQHLAFSVTPNPFTNAFQVTYYDGSFDDNVSLSVFDATGRVVFETKTIASPETRLVNTSHWAGGFYIVEFQANGLVERLKVVKQ